MSFEDVIKKYRLEKKGNFWKYLQLRDCIIKGKFSQESNTIVDFCKLPVRNQRAAVLYKLLNNSRDNICENLRMIWQRDLGENITEEEWHKIMLHSCKFVKEARGKFTQYKLIHRWYFTPSKLQRMGIMNSDVCWKCQSNTGTFLHAIWECNKIYPFWVRILDQISVWIDMAVPKSPRLCLLGDMAVIPGRNKCKYSVLKVGILTAARVILSVWKDPSPPMFREWKENMIKAASYERMLARMNDDMDGFDESWGQIFES